MCCMLAVGTRVWHELLSHMQLALDSPVSNRVLSLATQITYIQPGCLMQAGCGTIIHARPEYQTFCHPTV